MAEVWEGKINPTTGKTFGSSSEYDAYMASRGPTVAAPPSPPAPDPKTFTNEKQPPNPWGGPEYESDYTWTRPSMNYGQDQNRIYFGVAPDDYPMNQDSSGDYYIDTATGTIHYRTYGGSGAAGSTGEMGQAEVRYNPNWDYGLGPNARGVIPLHTDASGTPIGFFVMTPGGGGQVFDSLEDALATVEAYKTWYMQTQAVPKGATNVPTPPPTPGGPYKGTGAPGGGTGGTGGALTTPGAGEEAFETLWPELLKGPQRGDRAFGDRPTQPTNAEQYWNQWSGTFGNPDSLQAMYDRAQGKAQTTLDRKSSSAGWADSSAAAKATANIGLDFQDAYTKALQDFAKTGGGLASAADEAREAQTQGWLGVVSGADALDRTDLAYKLGALGAAKTAQELMEGRLTGGLDRAIIIARYMSDLASSGLAAAQQEDLALFMAGLEAQMGLGKIDYASAQADLDEYMAAMGLGAQAAASISKSFATRTGNTTSTGTTGSTGGTTPPGTVAYA